MRSHNTSGYTGVSWHNKKRKWHSRCVVNKTVHHLGYYDDPEEASRVYEEFAKKHFGEYYRENKLS
jgi:hypothetical protein